MSERFDFSLCGLCGTSAERGTNECPACGGAPMFPVTNGYVLEFPAHSIPCPSCGSSEQAVRLRGWTQLLALVWWVRESRMGAYLCPECARRQTIKSLLFSTLLGWWSIPSWFFYGWRALYINWRAAFAAPSSPYDWGALSAGDFAAMLEDMTDDTEVDPDDQWLLDAPVFRDLSETQIGLVLSAHGLYESLGAAPTASTDELRRAYRQRCKEVHPDLNQGARDGAEDMVRLNRAWEILRAQPLRDAYDWLEAQRSEAPA